MKNIKHGILQICTVILIINFLTGCFDLNSSSEYKQFTPDELGHLYIDRDSLVYDGNRINYTDTIAFLRNSKDTLLALVITKIYDWKQTFDGESCLTGDSRIYFDVKSEYGSASVLVIRESSYNDAQIILNFAMLDTPTATEYLDSSLALDTAKVLGKTFNNVYKFEYPDNSPTKLKRIYFAKKFGFIKVETSDGRKIEKLDLSKDEIRTLLSD